MIEAIDELIKRLKDAKKNLGGDAPVLHNIYVAGDIREGVENYCDDDTEDDRKCREMVRAMQDKELLEMFENEYFQPEADDYYESIGGVAEQLQKRIKEKANQDEQR